MARCLTYTFELGKMANTEPPHLYNVLYHNEPIYQELGLKNALSTLSIPDP